MDKRTKVAIIVGVSLTLFAGVAVLTRKKWMPLFKKKDGGGSNDNPQPTNTNTDGSGSSGGGTPKNTGIVPPSKTSGSTTPDWDGSLYAIKPIYTSVIDSLGTMGGNMSYYDTNDKVGKFVNNYRVGGADWLLIMDEKTGNRAAILASNTKKKK